MPPVHCHTYLNKSVAFKLSKRKYKLTETNKRFWPTELFITFACYAKSFGIAFFSFPCSQCCFWMEFFFFLCFFVFDLDRTYDRNMAWHVVCFKPCPLEINSNWIEEHVESSSSTTENIITSLTQCLWQPKMLLPVKSHDTLIRWSREIRWQTKNILCNQSACGHQTWQDCNSLPIKSNETMITRSWKITWQNKIIISPLIWSLWPPNLGRWWLTLRGFYR